MYRHTVSCVMRYGIYTLGGVQGKQIKSINSLTK